MDLVDSEILECPENIPFPQNNFFSPNEANFELPKTLGECCLQWLPQGDSYSLALPLPPTICTSVERDLRMMWG